MQTQRVLELDGQLEAVGGLRLYYRGWEADAPCATLVVAHGLSEHSGRYVEFGRAMAAFGISTFCLDLRGHGLSEGRRGHVDHFHLLLQDIDRFRREVGSIAGTAQPQFLLGHSMGGLITARYVEEYESDLAGAVIISPWLGTAMPIPRWKVVAASFLNRVLPSLPISAGIDERWLSHDPLVVRRYRDDALVHGKITPRLFTEVGTAMGLVTQRSDRIRIPLLLLLAGDDRIVDTTKSESFARSLTGGDVTVRVLPDYYHEVLNDHDRALAQFEIRDWIMARLPDRQS